MNQNQLYSYILNELKVKGFKNPELLEELTDHYMSQYEVENTDFDKHADILNSVKNNIDNLTIKQFDMNNTKQYLNTSISLLAILLFSFSYYYFSVASDVQIDPNLPDIWPVAYNQNSITSEYGMMMHPIHNIQKLHKGVDFKGSIGEPIFATSDGRVSVSKSQESGYGNHIIIDHDALFQTKYCHLSKLLVNVGDNVVKGDIIGHLGSSGSSSSPHLHYEILKDGENINPSNYL